MNDCCNKYDSKFCPECGSKISFKHCIPGRILASIEKNISRITKELNGPKWSGEADTSPWKRKLIRRLEELTTQADWLRPHIAKASAVAGDTMRIAKAG